jgi:hypothetical protein
MEDRQDCGTCCVGLDHGRGVAALLLGLQYKRLRYKSGFLMCHLQVGGSTSSLVASVLEFSFGNQFWKLNLVL